MGALYCRLLITETCLINNAPAYSVTFVHFTFGPAYIVTSYLVMQYDDCVVLFQV